MNVKINNIEKILLKNNKKIINIEELKKIINNYYKKGIYKIIYTLKNRGILISLKKDLFYIKKAEENININDIIDNFYWTICKDIIEKYTNKRYIGSYNALFLHLNFYEPQDVIYVVNENINKKISIFKNKYIAFVNYSAKENNYFKNVNKFTEKLKIGKVGLKIAKLELAILESLYQKKGDIYTIEMIKKVIKKKELNYELFEKILKLGKHHSSINRFYKIVKTVNPKISEKIKEIIKKYSYIL